MELTFFVVLKVLGKHFRQGTAEVLEYTLFTLI
jgi:hypothetical protein